MARITLLASSLLFLGLGAGCASTSPVDREPAVEHVSKKSKKTGINSEARTVKKDPEYHSVMDDVIVYSMDSMYAPRTSRGSGSTTIFVSLLVGSTQLGPSFSANRKATLSLTCFEADDCVAAGFDECKKVFAQAAAERQRYRVRIEVSGSLKKGDRLNQPRAYQDLYALATEPQPMDLVGFNLDLFNTSAGRIAEQPKLSCTLLPI